MKNSILLSALAVLVSFTLIGAPMTAQAKGKSGKPAASTATSGEITPAILKQLGLSKTQKKDIKKIEKSTTDKKEQKTKIMAVLTPTQRTKLQQLLGGTASGHKKK